MTDTTPNPEPETPDEPEETPEGDEPAAAEHAPRHARDDEVVVADPETGEGYVRRHDDPPPAEDPEREPSHPPIERPERDEGADTEGGET